MSDLSSIKQYSDLRLFYQRYPISQKPSHQLSGSHYALERGFYEQQVIMNLSHRLWDKLERTCGAYP